MPTMMKNRSHVERKRGRLINVIQWGIRIAKSCQNVIGVDTATSPKGRQKANVKLIEAHLTNLL